MPTQARLRKLLKYDPPTGELSYKIYRSHFKAGHRVGHDHYKGYRECTIDKRVLKVHRVIWTLVNGPIPKGYQIDHINGVRSDNRLYNLRLTTLLGNCHNRCRGINNTSGYIGVHWRKERKRWVARILIDRKVKILGSFGTPEEAHQARKHAEIALGYYPEHGKEKATPEGAAVKLAA